MSSKVFSIDTAYFELMKSAPNYDSESDNITAFIICEIFMTAPLFGRKLVLLEIK